MKILNILPVAFALMLVSCAGSGESSDKEAKAEFETRNEVAVSENTKDWEFAWEDGRGGYIEYFRFSCTPEEFADLGGKLGAKSDVGTYLASDAPGPGKPHWWKIAPRHQSVLHKEGFTTAAGGSAMSFWYDKDSGFAYMQISLWD